MSASEPRIDLSRIHFPSDGLSFKILRGKFPELIDADTKVTLFHLPVRNQLYHAQNLTNLLEGEREVATMAFAAALGRVWEQPSGFTAKEVKQYLTDDYLRYGLASGKHHAGQLIRAIETAATEQARQHLKSR